MENINGGSGPLKTPMRGVASRRATSKSALPYRLDSQLMFFQKFPLHPFEKDGNRKSPFVKGYLEGFFIYSTPL